MKDIKFRVRNKNNGHLYIFNLKGISQLCHLPDALDWDNLMQYTGLHDKNGKEIWEGDILQSCESFALWRTGELERAVVAWHEKLARFGLDFYTIYGGEGYTGKDSNIDEYVKMWTVIGNIHENPELVHRAPSVHHGEDEMRRG